MKQKAPTEKSKLTGRPHTMKSGVALMSNYSVQHRSDILMEEQIIAVTNQQDELRRSLADLESAKTEVSIDKYRADVQELRAKSEKAVMSLMVLHKVNMELGFARAELEEALDHQKGDINEARKRVMWLEDRMGMLCGKVRLRGKPVEKKTLKSHRSPDRSAFHSRLGSDSGNSDESSGQSGGQRMGRNMSPEFKSASNRPQMFSPSESGSDMAYAARARPGMQDTPSSDAESYLAAQQKVGMAGMMRGPGLDDSDSNSEAGLPPPGMPPMSGPRLSGGTSESGSEPEGGGQAYTQQVREYSTAPGAQVADSIQPIQEEATIEATDESSSGDKTPTGTGETRDSEDEEREVGDEDVDADDEQTVSSYKGDVEHESERSESPQSSVTDTTDMTGSSRQDADHEEKPAFMTEVSFAKSVTIHGPRQSIPKQASLNDEKSVSNLQKSVVTDEDFARDYWYSEHHRFEYSRYSEVLCELDPVSYHTVGLAIPGSFLPRPDDDFDDLPWRPRRKGSEITDIHKLALDKLAHRVHNLYDKFFDAAMMSVRPPQPRDALGRKETTMFSYDASNNREAAPSTSPMYEGRPGLITATPTTMDPASRPQTMSSELVPSKLKLGHNVYYPKPIPPPELLPLTRTSQDKQFPKLADEFAEEDILRHKPAVRIVDQRNLQKETKLKLYRERTRSQDAGPSTTEKKFQMMLERDKSSMSRSSRSSGQTTPVSSRSSGSRPREELQSLSSVSKSLTTSLMTRGLPGTRLSMVKTFTKADQSSHADSEQASTWSKLKPSSRGKEYGGLRWERVKTVVHVNLVSKRAEERRDAAKHLGILRCGDAMVFFALKERLKLDEDSRVRYEAAKSLVLLGCWEEDVLQVLLKYLILGNTEIRQDLIHTMTHGKNVQYVNKKTATFPELVKVLSHLCQSPDPDDSNAFDAAVLLGRFCVSDENAKFKLLRALNDTTDTHIKARALEVLVKQLGCTMWEVVNHLLNLFKESPVWKYRALAADLLIVIGREHVCKRGEEERIYQILERKLWDDPMREVRVAAAKALSALGMFSKACGRIEKRLEDLDEDVRAQAVISVGTLEMKNEKIIRLLLEMLELDTSEYVRLMIARTFTILKMTDKRVLRALRERDKVEGALSRESRKALKVLESLVNQPRIVSPGYRRSASRGTQLYTATPAVIM